MGKAGRGRKGKGKESGSTDPSSNAAKSAPPEPVLSPVEKLVDTIRRGDMALFDKVLQENAAMDVNQQTRQGDVPLVEACRYARREMVTKLLRDKHANVNAASTNQKGGRNQLRPLHAAVMTLDKQIVEVILNAPKQTVDLTAIYDVAMPVTISVFFSVANGYTQVQQEKALAILDLLLDHAKAQGPDQLKKVLETETSKGNRLVHIAVVLANYQAVVKLKAVGADFTAPNAVGLSALQLIESNAFNRRSFAISRLPMRSSGKTNKRQFRRSKPIVTKEADEEQEEPVSAAETELKSNQSVTKLERSVEDECVLRTLLPLIDVFGLGQVFSRKGHDGIRSIHIKSLVLAHEGLFSVINKIAALPDSTKPKDVYVDGVLHCVTSLYSLSLKSDTHFGKLWKQAFTEAPMKNLTEEAVALVLGVLLEHKSLSKRVKVWTMILVQSLRLFSGELITDASTVPVSVIQSVETYKKIANALYRSGGKILFFIFDRTEIDEDESYDEELEFHLFIALTELFFQLFIPLSLVVSPNEVVATLREVSQPIKRLWVLVEAALSNLNETFSSPQRFSLVLHVLQVFEVVEAGLEQNQATASAALFRVVRAHAKQEMAKKKMVYETTKQVQLLQKLSELFALPKSLIDKVTSMKDKIDLLLRSDAKILGMDLYAFARQQDIVHLEHKVDYLEVVTEEQSGSVHVSISRASNANYVEFILQQILSTSANKMRGELDIALIDEPGVGAGVVREFFQMIQRTFFSPRPLQLDSAPTTRQPDHVTEIGSSWLQMARDVSPSRGRGIQRGSAGKGKRTSAQNRGDIHRFFPLFECAAEKTDVLRIAQRQLQVSQEVAAEKQLQKSLHLTTDDLLINSEDQNTLNQLYLCTGRLLGLAIRDQQPLDANFSGAFWKFMLNEEVTWQEYCGANETFKSSLQFILDHDFDAEPLDMHFEYTTEVVVVPTDPATQATTLVVEMKLPARGSPTVVNNANKLQYVEARAKQFFFGNEIELYRKMRKGLNDTIRGFDLKLFSPLELQRVVRGERNIDLDGLRKIVIYNRGVNESHEVVCHFWEVVSAFDHPMKEKLLTFWSGSALPPLFGFSVAMRSNPHASSWYLDVEPNNRRDLCPTANTCERRLMLPQYPSKKVLKEMLLIALEHGAVGYDRM